MLMNNNEYLDLVQTIKQEIQQAQYKATLSVNKDNPQFVVIKSWNEWAEGNYLEPDVKFGRKWLEKIKQVKNETNTE